MPFPVIPRLGRGIQENEIFKNPLNHPVKPGMTAVVDPSLNLLLGYELEA